MQSDPRVVPQTGGQGMVDVHHTIWLGCDIQVIVESVQLSCDGSEGSVLPQTKEEGHHGVTLFAPLALWNVVHSPKLILPQELGWGAVEHADKRQHLHTIRHVDETLHHGAAGNQVECPHPIN